MGTALARHNTEPFAFVSVVLGVQLLVTMVCLLVAEAVVPSGSHPVRDLRARLGRTKRYFEIVVIAVRHGLGPYLRGRRSAAGVLPQRRAELARSLRMALEDAGVTFVKFGQMLSTRRDLLPTDVIDELARLQQRVAPVPWPAVHAVLEDELGAVESTFAAFDQTPLAAASIAQVHRARLCTGEDVVIKVQRPGIADAVDRDLDIVRRLAGSIEARRRRGVSVLETIDAGGPRGLNAVELADGFARAIREELDFRVEARNIAAVTAAARRRGDEGAVHLPVVHERLSSRRVLVMERLDGLALGEADAVLDARGIDRHALACGLLDTLLRQIITDGVFHADPHPGNVFLLPDGRLGLLDFGSVGRLDVLVRGALQQLLAAIQLGDPNALRDALLELAQPAEMPDEQRLTRDVGQFMARHLSPGVGPDVSMFTELFGLVAEHGLTIPPEAGAVFRALATLEGTLAQLDPGFDIVAEARSFAKSQLEPTALHHAARDELVAALPKLRHLPGRLDHITEAVEHGRLSVNVRLLADERDRRVITKMLDLVLLAFLASATGIMGALLLNADGGPLVTTTVSLFQLLGYNFLVVSLLLVLRVLFVVFRGEPRH